VLWGKKRCKKGRCHAGKWLRRGLSRLTRNNLTSIEGVDRDNPQEADFRHFNPLRTSRTSFELREKEL